MYSTYQKYSLFRRLQLLKYNESLKTKDHFKSLDFAHQWSCCQETRTTPAPQYLSHPHCLCPHLCTADRSGRHCKLHAVFEARFGIPSCRCNHYDHNRFHRISEPPSINTITYEIIKVYNILKEKERKEIKVHTRQQSTLSHRFELLWCGSTLACLVELALKLH